MADVLCTSWQIIGEDEGGSILSVDYICPDCGFPAGLVTFTTQTGLKECEIDLECNVCEAPHTILCPSEYRI